MKMCSGVDKSIVYFLAGLEKFKHNESESVANTREREQQRTAPKRVSAVKIVRAREQKLFG